MSNKLLVIGIDSMDAVLVEKYSDHLKFFPELSKTSSPIKMKSVFPPDSDTAWASIYTGLNPARHGVVHFVDPIVKTSIYETTDYLNSEPIRKKTFWDFAGENGKKVCVVFPHLGYPPWEVNGIMVSRDTKNARVQCSPEDIGIEIDAEKIAMPKRIPNSRSEYDSYISTLRKVINQEFMVGEQAIRNAEWDLFFIYSSALDFVQHIFWNFCDPNDPMFPGESNPLRNTILDFYRLYDQLIGDLVACTDDQTAVMVLSDHGHCMRPVNLVNINEVLRQKGFLVSREKKTISHRYLAEKLKRIVVNTVQRTALRSTALKLLRKFPVIAEVYAVPSTIDFSRTIAHCTDLSGMKSYSYGGIVIRREHLNSDEEYERTRQEIIDLLSKMTLEHSDEKVFQWVCSREELYEGNFLDRYPDILFKIQEGIGAGWAIHEPIFTKSSTHSFYPGSHCLETPILFLRNVGGVGKSRSECRLMDISPTILQILGVDWKGYQFDGQSIFDSTQ